MLSVTGNNIFTGRYAVYMLLFMLFAPALCSCVYDDAPSTPASTDPDAMYISFSLVMHGGQRLPVSRAGVPDPDGIWGGNYVPGDATAFDERIPEGSLHATLYDADGSCLGKLVNILCTSIRRDEAGDDIYEFRGMLALRNTSITTEDLSAKTAVRMMVTAYGDGTSIPSVMEDTGLSVEDAGLGSLAYSDCYGIPGNSFTAIPMWGVCTHSLAGIMQGKVLDIGSVKMLRSMAKIEVGVSADPEAGLENVTVTGVTVNRLNTGGYVLPGKWNKLAGTGDLEFSNTIRIPADVKTMTNCRFSNMEPSKPLVFYLPECVNSEGDSEIVITVEYKVGIDEKTGNIYIRPYENGKPVADTLWDIVRNHYYQYEITAVGSTDEDLRFNVTIADMEKGGDYVLGY